MVCKALWKNSFQVRKEVYRISVQEPEKTFFGNRCGYGKICSCPKDGVWYRQIYWSAEIRGGERDEGACMHRRYSNPCFLDSEMEINTQRYSQNICHMGSPVPSFVLWSDFQNIF